MKNACILFSKVIFSIQLFAQTNLNWWYNTNDASFGQSAAADIDGDGKLELVFGCYRNDSSIYALNAENGTLLWKYNAHGAGAEGCNDVAPLIIDVDNDMQLDVIVPSSCNPKTFCFDGLTGEVKWQCNTKGSDSPPTAADFDNDGKLEILHGEFGGYVICIDAESGEENWEIAVDENSWIQTAPTIVDLDGNGQLDFVVGTWNFYGMDSVYAYRGDTHEVMWTFPIHDYMYHGTAVSDLDSDNKPELVIGSYNDTLYCLNAEDGTLNWKYAGSGGYIGAPASIADIDNDGSCEVVFFSSYQVTALSAEGEFKWQYLIDDYEQAFRGAALSDINNDLYPDVIFGTNGGKVYALNGNSGSKIWEIDLAAHYGDDDFALDHAPLISDFDGDDSLDVFIVGGHAEYPEFENNFGRAYMFTAGKGNGPDWLMFQHDQYRQSSLCSDDVDQINEFSHQNQIQVFPNPASNKLTIQTLHAKMLRIEIYNSYGAKVISTPQALNSFSEIIDIKKLHTGIYFIRLKNEAGEEVIKFMKN